MKVKVESMKIVCDCCGETFHDGNDFVCFFNDPDGSLIESEATDSDWRKYGDKHFCPDCWSWDDNSNVIIKDGHKYDGETDEEIK